MIVQMQNHIEMYIRDAQLAWYVRTGARLRQELNVWFWRELSDIYVGKTPGCTATCEMRNFREKL
jgi:hypothetical protein